MRLVIFVVSILFMTITHTIEAQGLDDYQWKNRILLLVDESSGSDVLTSQLAALTADQKALTERDLIIFRVTPNMVYTSDRTKTELNPQRIYEDCDLDTDFNGVVLLGKDGGVKMREPFEVAAQRIYGLIDGMPMRRRETRESGGN